MLHAVPCQISTPGKDDYKVEFKNKLLGIYVNHTMKIIENNLKKNMDRMEGQAYTVNQK